jgi:protein-S-isoprenylcysteine O-methyltransferase Ste14
VVSEQGNPDTSVAHAVLGTVRHVLAILLLPFGVVVVVPALLLQRYGHGAWGSNPAAAWLPLLGGGLLFLCGFALFAWCVALFAHVGRGTLAPWDPTRNLVAVGPYRHVRNPMITGVATMLAGEALLQRSVALAIWFGAFVVLNHVYFLVSEEPGLEQRFGESYLRYKASVPRWLPRLGRRTPRDAGL